ncbi:hypothetical protein pb186bvf_007250 [Paramecium bursaria]
MHKNDKQIIIQYPGQPTYTFEDGCLIVEGKKHKLDSMSIILQQDKQNRIKIYDRSISFDIFGQWNQLDLLFEDLKKYCFQSHLKKYYEIRKLVGQGSFGKVYQAIHIKSSKKYAIKQLDKELLYKSKSELQLEIDILRRLNHETCIHIYEQFLDDKYIYLVLDYINGGELFDYLDQQVQLVDESSVRDIMRTLFEALEYIHSKGIVHRDLKPENILIRNKACLDLVISDFGLADICIGQLNQRCGTLGFVAPEILNGKPYDFKVDVFSLGVILYVILVGEYPFEDENSDLLLMKNSHANINYHKPQLQLISDDGLDFLQKCLSYDPKNRLSAKDAIKHPWLSKRQIDSRFIIDTSLKIRDFKSLKNIKSHVQFDSILSIDSFQLIDQDETELPQFMDQYQMKIHFRNEPK